MSNVDNTNAFAPPQVSIGELENMLAKQYNMAIITELDKIKGLLKTTPVEELKTEIEQFGREIESKLGNNGLQIKSLKANYEAGNEDEFLYTKKLHKLEEERAKLIGDYDKYELWQESPVGYLYHKHPEIKDFVKNVYKDIPATLLRSSPGQGKSSMVRGVGELIQGLLEQAYTKANISLELMPKVIVTTKMANTITITNLQGLPAPDFKAGMVKWLKDNTFPREGDPNIHIVFVDEVGNALPHLQNLINEMMLDRKIDGENMADRCFLISAGNRVTDKSGAIDINSTFANRTQNFEVHAAYDEWAEVAKANNFNIMLQAYMQFHNEVTGDSTTKLAIDPASRTAKLRESITSGSSKGRGSIGKIGDILKSGTTGSARLAKKLSITDREFKDKYAQGNICFPSPRTWEMVSKTLNEYDFYKSNNPDVQINKSDYRARIQASVGRSAAEDFYTFWAYVAESELKPAHMIANMKTKEEIKSYLNAVYSSTHNKADVAMFRSFFMAKDMGKWLEDNAAELGQSDEGLERFAMGMRFLVDLSEHVGNEASMIAVMPTLTSLIHSKDAGPLVCGFIDEKNDKFAKYGLAYPICNAIMDPGNGLETHEKVRSSIKALHSMGKENGIGR